MVMGSRALSLLLPHRRKRSAKAAEQMTTKELATAMIPASGTALE
jgi:hypothetical protein